MLDSDARLGAAIREMALRPGADKTLLVTVVSGDWLSTYEIRLLNTKPKPEPKRVGGVLVLHPKRSAPGPTPAPDGGERKEQ